ncbi:MAG: hypothetical protein JWN45_2809 [Acidobacteriaceae bacterium]|nr:hypothetical protein [Acidobacteriaceae bacterium]
MNSFVLTYVLWLAAPAVQLGILFFMFRRKLRSEFPFFFSYTALQVINVAVLFTIYHFRPAEYFYIYWTAATVSIFMGFAVIHEVFCYAMRPYIGLRDLGSMLFRWAALILVLFSGLLALSSAITESHPIMAAIISLERSVRLMQCGLLLFIFVCSTYLGLTWKNFASGIALGFGLVAATDLVMFSLRAQFGQRWDSQMSLINSLIYNLSVLLWFGYTIVPKDARKRVPSEVVYRPLFDRWNQAAMALVTPSPALVPAVSGHTYLTEIERTVENIMAQKAAPSSNGHSEKDNQKVS